MHFKFFWIILLVCFGVILLRKFLNRQLKLSSPKESSFPEEDTPTSFKNKASGKIPEELKQAGLRVLDSLDWDIRFLEKQRLEATDPKKRQELDAQLNRKREEYHATAERLDLL
ncbi:hypothetical protein WDW89_14400 [Deltaproteobacteria bacterium TL4]